MSAQNGERARFHRNRKRRVVQRMRLRAALLALKEQKAATAADAAPPARRAGAARHWRATEMAAATAAPVWRTILLDSLGFVLVMWSIPAAIVLVGAPIVLACVAHSCAGSCRSVDDRPSRVCKREQRRGQQPCILQPWSIAQLESPLRHPPPPVFLGSEAAGQPVAFRSQTHRRRSTTEVREDAFIWTVAHELRQPLSAMTTAVAVMEHDSPSAATAHAIAVMGRQLRHMSRMVDDLLDAARLSTGKVSLIPQRLDIREVMTDAAADIAAEAAKRGQLLDVKCGAAPLWVNADRQRLYQVFSNLLRNAIKFTGHGGRITFTADSHDVEDRGAGARYRPWHRPAGAATDLRPLHASAAVGAGRGRHRIERGAGDCEPPPRPDRSPQRRPRQGE